MLDCWRWNPVRNRKAHGIYRKWCLIPPRMRNLNGFARPDGMFTGKATLLLLTVSFEEAHMARLSARLAKLEQVATPEAPRVIWLSVSPATRDATPKPDSDVIGCHSMGRRVSRLAGESIETMKARAMDLMPTAVLWFMAYASRESSRAVFEQCSEAATLH